MNYIFVPSSFIELIYKLHEVPLLVKHTLKKQQKNAQFKIRFASQNSNYKVYHLGHNIIIKTPRRDTTPPTMSPISGLFPSNSQPNRNDIIIKNPP